MAILPPPLSADLQPGGGGTTSNMSVLINPAVGPGTQLLPNPSAFCTQKDRSDQSLEMSLIIGLGEMVHMVPHMPGLCEAMSSTM